MQENLYKLNLACIKRGQAIEVWSLGVFSLSRALVITLSRGLFYFLAGDGIDAVVLPAPFGSAIIYKFGLLILRNNLCG